MKVFTRYDLLNDHLNEVRSSSKKIGFVPTMGALHEGHISLIKHAQEQTDYVVASIFVNPTQFNNPDDLSNYPRMIDSDVALLEANGCDCVFIPSVETMYPSDYKEITLNLAPLDYVMEGKHRPGHFNGVVNVVKRFFDMIQPQVAFFGNKDFQQVAIIKAMTKKLKLPVQIVGCPTLRTDNGLALSSRNLLLTKEQQEQATALYKTLLVGKRLANYYSPTQTLTEMISHFNHSALKLEYLEIVDPDTLLPIKEEWVPGTTACIVAHCGNVRLIDNLTLIPVNALVEK